MTKNTQILFNILESGLVFRGLLLVTYYAKASVTSGCSSQKYSMRSSEKRNRLKQEFIQLLYMNIIQKTSDHEVDLA